MKTCHFVFDDTLQIKTKIETGKTKVEKNTPYTNLIYKRIKDMECKLGIIRSLCKRIDRGGTYIDLMCGVGFVSKVVEKYLTPGYMILNDIDKSCVEQIRFNFPHIENIKKGIITEKDARSFNNWTKCNLLVIDYNSFSLYSEGYKWKDVLFQCAKYANNIIICDTYCYSLRFIKKEYREEQYAKYLKKMRRRMKRIYKLTLIHYATYPDMKAAYFLFSNSMEYVYPRRIMSWDKVKITGTVL